MTQASENTASVRTELERLLDAFFERYPDNAVRDATYELLGKSPAKHEHFVGDLNADHNSAALGAGHSRRLLLPLASVRTWPNRLTVELVRTPLHWGRDFSAAESIVSPSYSSASHASMGPRLLSRGKASTTGAARAVEPGFNGAATSQPRDRRASSPHREECGPSDDEYDHTVLSTRKRNADQSTLRVSGLPRS